MKLNRVVVKRRLYKILLVVPVIIMIHAPLDTFSAVPDTVKVNSVGKNNKVTVNSQELDASYKGKVDAPVEGHISQNGENNSVVINTNKKNKKTNLPPVQCPVTNDQCPVTNDQCQMTSDPCPDSRQHIKVTQSGSNNSVKINSR